MMMISFFAFVLTTACKVHCLKNAVFCSLVILHFLCLLPPHTKEDILHSPGSTDAVSFTSEGLVYDEFGFGSKVECTEGIKIVFVFWGNIGDHDGVCRATQRVL